MAPRLSYLIPFALTALLSACGGSGYEIDADAEGSLEIESQTAVGDPNKFEIEVAFASEVSPEVEAVVREAAARWERVITKDLGDSIKFEADTELCDGSKFTASKSEQTWDDLKIFVRFQEIDGPSKTLAQARPCRATRINGKVIPRAGELIFDEKDIGRLYGNGQLLDTVTHEFGHVLGIGTLWNDNDLLDASKSEYLGAEGAAGLAAVGGAGRPKVEVHGGPGTAGNHWEEDLAGGGYGNELMTGFIRYKSNPLSKLTVMSLGDIGYTVDASKAEEFDVTRAALRIEDHVELGDDTIPGTIRMLDE